MIKVCGTRFRSLATRFAARSTSDQLPTLLLFHHHHHYSLPLMRFVSDLYEHPDLTDSEVWDKDANNRSGARVVTAMGILSLATIASILAAAHYVGYERLSKAAGIDESTLRLWFITES